MIEIINCQQGSPEWFAARAGIPTSSEFHTVMASGRDGGDSKTRRTYLLKLAGEILTGEPAESFSNAHTDRGHEMEPKARRLYSFVNGVEIQQIGFIRNGSKGCSPDGLVGNDGMTEFKSKAPHIFIEHALRDRFPAEHVAQCQGNLWVAEREWIDITLFWPNLTPFTKRAYRDEPYIAKLDEAVEKFNAELHEIVEKMRRYGALEAA